MSHGEHSKDTVGVCPQCGTEAPLSYNGTQIFSDESVGGSMWEHRFYTCGLCGSTHMTTPVTERPDLDGEFEGAVIDRRGGARDSELEAVMALFGEDYVPPAASDTIRPGVVWA